MWRSCNRANFSGRCILVFIVACFVVSINSETVLVGTFHHVTGCPHCMGLWNGLKSVRPSVRPSVCLSHLALLPVWVPQAGDTNRLLHGSFSIHIHSNTAVSSSNCFSRRSRLNAEYYTASLRVFDSFLPRDATLARYLLSSCVCLSQAGIVPKRTDESSYFTTRRYPSAVYCRPIAYMPWPCVRLCLSLSVLVCPFVTSRSSIEAAVTDRAGFGTEAFVHLLYIVF